MAQTPPEGAAPRRTAPPDLDALLESLQVEARPAASKVAPVAEAGGAGDVMARRVQALIKAFDVLHRQVGAIATQGETIAKVADTQARDGKALADLQRTVRSLRAVVIQQLQQGSAANANLPPIQIKLVVGHFVEQVSQAERDVAVLMGWAMLFTGLAVGMALAAVIAAVSQLLQPLPLFAAIAVVALGVALIFASLARSARLRAAAARRAMDESTLLRSVGLGAAPEPPHV